MTKTAKRASSHHPMAKQHNATMDRILDAAEELFSQRGIEQVMLKDVAEHVGVHSSLLRYYVRDKQDLFHAVLDQRTPMTSERRLAALNRYEQEHAGDLTIEGILHAYLDAEPANGRPDDRGWRHFGALGARVTAARAGGEALLDAYFEPVMVRLICLLKKAQPSCRTEDILWSCHFLSGALAITLAGVRRSGAKTDNCFSYDLSDAKKRLIAVAAAGLRDAHLSRNGARAKARRLAN
jgi:AcrR family transcriptional regulator